MAAASSHSIYTKNRIDAIHVLNVIGIFVRLIFSLLLLRFFLSSSFTHTHTQNNEKK